MKKKKHKTKTVVIPPPKKRPAPDKKHPEYKSGWTDAYNLQLAGPLSARFVKILTDSLWLTRKTPVPADDARYGYYLYCVGWNDQNGT